MSLLKWKELAKSKTELRNKINYVRDLITQHKIGENTSQESFAKVFKPVTSKLDDVIDSNLNLRMPQKRRPRKKAEVPNYGIDIEDEVEDMDLDDLFGDEVPPHREKRIVPKPPTYEESLADVLEGQNGTYADPQHFPQDPQEPPPEYDVDEEVDYTIDDYDTANMILNKMNMKNYEDVEYQLKQPIMTPKNELYLKKVVKDAILERHKLNGRKANVTKKIQ